MPKSAAPKPAKRKSQVKALAVDASPSDTKNRKSPFGRPPIYATAEDLHDAAEAYFARIAFVDEHGNAVYREPPTLSGIALELGYCDRQSFYDQAKRGEDFSCVVKKIKARINSFHEQRLAGGQPTGSIFFLKCHGGPDFREPASKHFVASKRVEDMSEEELVVFLGSDA